MSPFIDLDAATTIMGGGGHRDHRLGGIYTDRTAFFIDVGEMFDEADLVHMPAIEIDVFGTRLFHFAVEGPGHNIPWRQVLPLVVPAHEGLPFIVTKDTAV